MEQTEQQLVNPKFKSEDGDTPANVIRDAHAEIVKAMYTMDRVRSFIRQHSIDNGRPEEDDFWANALEWQHMRLDECRSALEACFRLFQQYFRPHT